MLDKVEPRFTTDSYNTEKNTTSGFDSALQNQNMIARQRRSVSENLQTQKPVTITSSGSISAGNISRSTTLLQRQSHDSSMSPLHNNQTKGDLLLHVARERGTGHKLHWDTAIKTQEKHIKRLDTEIEDKNTLGQRPRNSTDSYVGASVNDHLNLAAEYASLAVLLFEHSDHFKDQHNLLKSAEAYAAASENYLLVGEVNKSNREKANFERTKAYHQLLYPEQSTSERSANSEPRTKIQRAFSKARDAITNLPNKISETIRNWRA